MRPLLALLLLLASCRSAHPGPEQGASWSSCVVNVYPAGVCTSETRLPAPPAMPAAPGASKCASADDPCPGGKCAVPDPFAATQTPDATRPKTQEASMIPTLSLLAALVVLLLVAAKFTRRAAPLALFLLALPLGACRVMPATQGDLEDLRADEREVDASQTQAFKDYLLAHPGDVEGATAAAFGSALAVRDQQDAARPAPTEGGLPWVEMIGTALGATGLGGFLLSKHRNATRKAAMATAPKAA